MAATPTKSTAPRDAMSHETRFKQLDDEVAGIKTDLSVVQTDIKNHGIILAGLQHSQEAGFADIKSMMRDKEAEPPKVTTKQIVSMVSVGTILVGALWVTIKLLVAPIAENQRSHMSLGHHQDTAVVLSELKGRIGEVGRDLSDKITAVEGKSRDRDQNQALQLEEKAAAWEHLREARLKEAELWGRLSERLVAEEKLRLAHNVMLDERAKAERERTDLMLAAQADQISKLEEVRQEADAILRKEMSELDTVLEKQMALHVARLEALIMTNSGDLKQVKESRFTNEDGDRLYRSLDAVGGGE